MDVGSTQNPKLPLSTSLTDPGRGEGGEKFLGVINGQSPEYGRPRNASNSTPARCRAHHGFAGI